MILHSAAREIATFPTLPPYAGRKVMMMPFRWGDPRTLSPLQLGEWAGVVERLCRLCPAEGVGYLTLDEGQLAPGETLRRPGVHVDCGGPWAASQPYSGTGMILLSSTLGARYWTGDIDGDPPGPEGECDHLDLSDFPAARMRPGVAYACTPGCVHAAIPETRTTRRQLLRLSLPSSAPHHTPHTHNVTGVLPLTPPGPARDAFMAFRPGPPGAVGPNPIPAED